MKKQEKILQKEILKRLSCHPYSKISYFRGVDVNGIYIPKLKTYIKNPMKGIADIIGCVEGKFVAIECKVGTNKLLPEQIDFRDCLLKAGGIHIEARNWLDVKNALKDVFGI